MEIISIRCKILRWKFGTVLTLIHIQSKFVKTYWRKALLIFDDISVLGNKNY